MAGVLLLAAPGPRSTCKAPHAALKLGVTSRPARRFKGFQECSRSESWEGLWQVPVWHVRGAKSGVWSMDYGVDPNGCAPLVCLRRGCLSGCSVQLFARGELGPLRRRPTPPSAFNFPTCSDVEDALRNMFDAAYNGNRAVSPPLHLGVVAVGAARLLLLGCMRVPLELPGGPSRVPAVPRRAPTPCGHSPPLPPAPPPQPLPLYIHSPWLADKDHRQAVKNFLGELSHGGGGWQRARGRNSEGRAPAPPAGPPRAVATASAALIPPCREPAPTLQTTRWARRTSTW